MAKKKPNELQRYTEAMMRGDNDAAYRIECIHGLDGYPPEIVSIGLKAYDEGRSPDEAVYAYLNDH